MRSTRLVLALLVAVASCSSRKAPPPPPAARAETSQLVIQGPVTIIDVNGTRTAAHSGPLDREGRLATGPGGRAVLTLPDGSRVEVNENDEVRWAASDKELVVTPGHAAEISRAKRRRGLDLVIKTPFGVARLPDESTELSLDIDRRRVAFELRMGNVGFVDNKGKHVELRMGSRIEVMLSGIEVIRPDGTRAKLAVGETEALEGNVTAAPASLPAPPAASLLLPMATDVQIHGDRLTEISLSWPRELAAARLEVARDHHFKNVTLAGRPEGNHVNVTPPRAGSLYWRVLDDDGQELKRAKARFTPGAEASSLNRASTVVTDSATAARLFYQSGAPAVTFAFTPHPRAVRYELRVVRLGPPRVTVVERVERGVRHTVKAGELRDGEYTWKATPIGADGKPLGEPHENRLSVTYDNAHVQLVIERPRPWERVGGAKVRVQGVAPLDSRLFVNGQEAPLDDKGRFNFPVDPAAALIFRLVGPSGNESLWVRGLKKGS